MREIKFRAWDTYDNKMIRDNEQAIKLMLVPRPDRYIFLQYTGLKDKNGKEIYERDVVNEHELGGIEYYKGCFYVCFPDGDIAFNGLISEQLEVLGNIYENPELLNSGEEKETSPDK